MTKIMKRFLENNKEFLSDIEHLEKITGKTILKKILANSDEINFLSARSEIKFGKYLAEKFDNNLEYEPNILEKKPDWLVSTNEDKIICEVLRINIPNEKLQTKIKSYEANELNVDTSGCFVGLGCLNQNDLQKVLKKEKTYRDLIINDDFKLIICIDASDWDKKIDVKDIKDSFDFKNDKSPFYHKDFTQNVSGLIVMPYLGDTKFIHNISVKNKLDPKNLEILKM
ncbi:hypothetical protein [Namhaeicola litoreus]|uniref:Uncharacterized protein n=1 Tax=Namhaeicola litoreus TaxID=1052145 RepID=A0ABW3Y6G7_9FLAO